MQAGMFSGLFGALTTEHRMNFIANNLANASTRGYKRDVLAFKDTMITYAFDEIREPLLHLRSDPLFPEPKNAARPRVAVSRIDFAQGSLQYSGNYQVQGLGGNIVIPPGTRHVQISRDGQVLADNAVIEQIALVSVDNPQNLEKMGNNLYRPRPTAQVEEGDAYLLGARLEQGFTEAANVEVVPEMVNMIEVHRQFEAYQKVMQTSDTLDRAATEKVGRRIG